MFGVLWYFATWFLAYMWIARCSGFRRFMSFGEACFASIIVGTIGGAWLVYLCACLTTVLSESTIAAATLLGYGFVWLRKPAALSSARGAELPPPRASSPVESKSSRLPVPVATKQKNELSVTKDDFIVVALVVFISIWLWPMYSHRMIPTDEHGNILAGGSCYGDLPIHMTIANSFLVGVNMEIKWGTMISPIFAGEYMTYPFLPDFHAAILVRLGETMRTGFLIPGFAMACALWAMLYYFSVRITKSRPGAALAIFLTMFAGGMGGWRWAQERGWDFAFNQDVIQHDPSGEWKFLWFAFIPHIMLPQRGGNFAYPMAVLCLLTLWEATNEAARNIRTHHRTSLLVHAAIFAASLPMVQAHAFIGVGIIIGVMCLGDAHKWLVNGRLFLGWAVAGISALVLALPQMTQFRKTVSNGFYGKFMTYGWLYHNYEFGAPYGIIGFFNFWWNSVGPAFYLFTASVLLYTLEAYCAWRISKRIANKKDDDDRAHRRPLDAESPAQAALDPYDQPSILSAQSFTNLLYKSVAAPVSSVIDFQKLLRAERLHSVASQLNELSPNHRSLDTIFLALGAFGVFLLGNYVNLQPWDRDNAKIYYIWAFVASCLSGPLLFVPFESLFGVEPGTRRLSDWLSPIFGVEEPKPAKKDTPAVRLKRPTQKVLSLGCCLVAPVIAFFCMLSGYILFSQEFHGNGIMLDRDAQSMGEFIKANVSPKAVIMHSNYHVQPSGAIAARPSLVSYYGWVSNHGYNSHERLGDRDYVMDNALKDSDEHAYFLCRKWGVRFLVGENIRQHPRATDKAEFDENLFLDGKLKRVYTAGRYELFEVLGY